MHKMLLIILGTPILACHTSKSQTKPTTSHTGASHPICTSLKFYDSSRHREIPVGLLYHTHKGRGKQKLAIFNHGYGGQYANYSSVLTTLEGEGYFVVAILHELPSDAPMPASGDIMTVRKPYWQRGGRQHAVRIKQTEITISSS